MVDWEGGAERAEVTTCPQSASGCARAGLRAGPRQSDWPGAERVAKRPADRPPGRSRGAAGGGEWTLDASPCPRLGSRGSEEKGFLGVPHVSVALRENQGFLLDPKHQGSREQIQTACLVCPGPLAVGGRGGPGVGAVSPSEAAPEQIGRDVPKEQVQGVKVLEPEL